MLLALAPVPRKSFAEEGIHEPEVLHPHLEQVQVVMTRIVVPERHRLLVVGDARADIEAHAILAGPVLGLDLIGVPDSLRVHEGRRMPEVLVVRADRVGVGIPGQERHVRAPFSW